MCCGTRMKSLVAGAPTSFVKEKAARTLLTAGFGSGDCSRVRLWRARWLPCPERNTSQPSCPVFRSSCPDDGSSASRELQPPPSRVPVAAHTERVYALPDACVRPRAATREDERYLGRPACTTP